MGADGDELREGWIMMLQTDLSPAGPHTRVWELRSISVGVVALQDTTVARGRGCCDKRCAVAP